MQRDAEGRLGVDSVRSAQLPHGVRELRERLDVEILPRLERPGRCLGPFVPVAFASPRDEIETVAVWRSTGFAKNPVVSTDPLAAELAKSLPHPIAWLTPPTLELARELSARDLPLFTRPSWFPVVEHRVQVLVLDEVEQIFDLYAALSLVGDRGRAADCLWVACGRAVSALEIPLREIAHLVLPTEEISPLLVELVTLSATDSLSLEVLGHWADDFGRSRGFEVLRGHPQPENWPSWPAAAKAEPRPLPRSPLLCPADLKGAASRWRGLGEGGGRLELLLFSASEARREELGIEWDDEDAARLKAALDDPFAPLSVHLAVGLPGDRRADLDHAIALVGQLREAAGVERRIEVQLRPYTGPTPKQAVSPAELRAWTQEFRSVSRPSKIRLVEPAAALPWILAVLEAAGERGAQVLRHLFTCGVVGGESPLAMDEDLWHKSLREADFGLPTRFREEEVSGPQPRQVPLRTGLEAILNGARAARSRADAAGSGDSPRIVKDSESRRWQKWKALVPRRFDVRIVYRNRGRMRFLSQGELGAIMVQRCRECDLPLATTGRVQPKLRMSFGPWLAVGIEGTQEYLDLGFRERIADLQRRLTEGLPAGFEVLAVHAVPLGQPQLALSRVARAEYEVSLGRQDGRNALDPLSQRVEDLRDRVRHGGPSTSDDLCHQLHDVHLSTDGDAAVGLAFTLDLTDPGPKRRPQDFLRLLLGDLVQDVRTLPIRRTRLLLRDETGGAPQWRTPAEVLESNARRIRKAEKTCA